MFCYRQSDRTVFLFILLMLEATAAILLDIFVSLDNYAAVGIQMEKPSPETHPIPVWSV